MNHRGINADIQVDGGVTLENAPLLLKAGANILVAGSSVFSGDPGANTKAFIKILNQYEAKA